MLSTKHFFEAKKIYKFLILGLLVFSLSACGSSSSEVLMDELSEDGLFVYKNKDLGFQVSFPETFDYYQVQRKNTDEYTEVEFFVPSSDRSYPQEVQSYAKPLVIRHYSNDDWELTNKKEYVKDVFVEGLSNENGKYFLKFWKVRPKDWQDKWSQEEEDKIKASFKSL